MIAEPIVRLMRSCFGVSAEDAGRIVDLLGVASFRFEPMDAPLPDAMLSLWRMEQWFGGRPVPAEALAFVGVDPPARGGGAATRLLRRALTEAREGGAAVATLYAATTHLYERLGFARAGVNRHVSCPPTCFGPPRPDLPMVRMTPVEADALAALRLRELQATNGGVTRNEAMWTLALHPDGVSDIDVYVSLGPEGLEGYVALAPPADDRLVVADVCVPTPGAAAAARGLLGSYRSRVSRVVWAAGPEDPLLHGLIEASVEIEAWEEWMLRVLNVPAALSARGWPKWVDGELNFVVDDSLFPENQGPWKLRLKDGRGFVTPTDVAGQSHIRVSSSALSVIFSGYLNAAALRRMGRIEADDEGVELLNSFFSVGYPFMSDHF